MNLRLIELPSGFSRLEELNSRFGTLGISEASLCDSSLSFDIFNEFAKHPMPGAVDTVSQRVWRKLPLGINLGKSNCVLKLKEHSEAFWTQKLSNVEGFKRRRWLKSLFISYLSNFSSDAPQFVAFFSRLEAVAKQEKNCLSEGLQRFLDAGFLDVKTGPMRFAQFAINGQVEFSDIPKYFDLNPDFLNSRFVAEAFHCIGTLPIHLQRTQQATKRLLVWCGKSTSPRYPTLSKLTAETILLAWRDLLPPQTQLAPLRDFILHNPYLGNLDRNNPNWVAIHKDCIQIFKRWMIGSSLDAFFEVLKATADSSWIYRERFWRTYFSLGAIEDVWIVFGVDAVTHIRSNTARYGHLRYGRFYEQGGGVARNQSLLIIKIGDIEFAEWSHSGSLRARYLKNAQMAKPSRCYGEDFKYDSLDFHEGANERTQLAHHYPRDGGWQDKARKFIRKHTGVIAQLADVCISPE